MLPVIIIFFVIIGVMRVVQKVCSKKVSKLIDGSTYFHYGAYYQLLSAAFSLIALIFVDFQGFDWKTFWFAVGAAVFTAIVLFTEMEALKGSSLIVGQMFDAGSIVIPCLFGHFFSNQPMTIWQWFGLLFFMFAMYLMLSQGKGGADEQRQKTSPRALVLLIVMWLAAGGLMIIQNGVGEAHSEMFCFIMFAVNALVLYVCYFVQGLLSKKTTANLDKQQNAVFKPLSKTFLICGAFLALALFAINFLVVNLSTKLSAIGRQPLLFPLSAAIAITVTTLVGRFVYKEKMLLRNIIGMVLSAISVIIIAMCTA